MNCPSCGQATAPHLERCPHCATALTGTLATGVLTPPSDGSATPEPPYLGGIQTPSPDSIGTGEVDLGPDSPTIAAPVSATAMTQAASTSFTQSVTQAPRGATNAQGPRTIGPLYVGQSFGRYHVIRVLGVGGMGVVYQAWDEQLEVAVAIKVIKPQITEDPAAAEAQEKRFKRELLLARQVTHRNVVRIHDLGEIDGVMYITMPYIQGGNLEAVIKKSGKLPVARALTIAKQLAGGLEAAHEAGIVHRDFKPANILIDGEDHATITDFGIARSVSAATAGTVGVVGTVEYMAPEQARGYPVDQRTDIYAFGLVLRDMLVGHRAAPGGINGFSELMLRMEQEPARATTIEPSIPGPVDALIDRCLRVDPAQRYQTTTELVAALAALDAEGHLVSPAPVPSVRRSWQPRPAILAVAAGVLLLAGVGSWWGMRSRPTESPVATGTPRVASLAILPFRNASGDASLDWLGSSLAETLRSGIGVSPSLHVVSSDRVHQVLKDLRLPADSNFDPATLRSLADFTSSDTIVWGQFIKFGDSITITGTLEDLKTQRSVVLKAEAANQGAVIAAVDQLAQTIRGGLAFTPAVVNELQATALKPSTQSLQALRSFDEGLALTRAGKPSEALTRFEAATAADPNFALAFSKLGQAYANLSYDNDAQRFSRRAVELSERLPPAERYQIVATHSRIINDTKKAIESYEQLLKVSPNDPQVQYDLATLYENSGVVDRARDHFAKALESDGKWIDALVAMGRIETKRRNPQGSLDYLNRALTLSVQLENDEARSRILQAIGITYKRLNRPDEALRNYEQSLAISRRLGQKGRMAASLAEIGQVQSRLGEPAKALAAYTEALQLRREIGDKAGIGNSLMDLGTFHSSNGRDDAALPLFRESLQIQRERGDINYEAVLLNNIGHVYRNKAQYDDAITNFERALELREKSNIPAETALTLHNLATTSSLLGQFDRAQQYFLRALELWRGAGDRRNAAAESYEMASIFVAQGRFGAATTSSDEAVKALRALNDQSSYLAEALSAYGGALAEIGRYDEASKALDEALTLGRELKHRTVIARTLNRQGDIAFYRGNAAQARALYQQALPEATATSDRALLLDTRIDVAKAMLSDGRAPASAAELQRAAADADRLGLQFVAAKARLFLGEAQMRQKQQAAARQTLEQAITTGEKLTLRPILAGGHHLLGHREEARRVLDEIRKEAGTADLLARADFAPIVAAP